MYHPETFSICVYGIHRYAKAVFWYVLIYEQENSHNFLVEMFPKLIIKEETYK